MASTAKAVRAATNSTALRWTFRMTLRLMERRKDTTLGRIWRKRNNSSATLTVMDMVVMLVSRTPNTPMLMARRKIK